MFSQLWIYCHPGLAKPRSSGLRYHLANKQFLVVGEIKDFLHTSPWGRENLMGARQLLRKDILGLVRKNWISKGRAQPESQE